MHQTIEDFLSHLEQEGKRETVRGYRSSLRKLDEWLAARGLDPLNATADALSDYQQFLSEEYVSEAGAPLETSTQMTLLCAVKALYRWLHRRGKISINVARKIQLPKVPQRVTRKDWLSLQEASALLMTQAARVAAIRRGSHRWAREHRTLTLLCLAIATGLRRAELRRLRVEDLDFRRNEIRVERVKGKAGRVLPVIPWAMAIAKEFVTDARPVLDWEEGNPWVFVGEQSPSLGNETFRRLLDDAVRATVQTNPDLADLPSKVITPHSLRVSFAKLLFNGGADIRTVNEMMMHERLGTTARYTPVPLEDLRRVCRTAHPRA